MNINPVLLNKKCYGLGHYPCDFTRSDDGKVMIPVRCQDDSYMLYSENFGKSFEKRPLCNNYKNCGFKQLSDGTFLAFGFSNAVFDDIWNPDIEDLPFYLTVYRANTADDIINCNVKTEFVKTDIPGLIAGYGDSGDRHSGCISGWRELSNGDIYLTAYGQFKDDVTLCPYFKKYSEYDFYLYRTWSLISHDKGRTFSFAGTIADCQTYPIADVNAEGYCEADLTEVEDGHLVCILRTGGHEIYSPLYCSHSHDYGKTWDTPYEICSWGVLPRILKMSDGTLVIASGHIHNILLFSTDNGKTWSKPFIIEECDGKWGKSTSGYTSLFECEPGVLSVVFDDPKEELSKGGTEGHVRKVYSALYRIDRK